MKIINNFIKALHRGRNISEAWGDALFINDLLNASKIAKRIKESKKNNSRQKY